MRILLCLCVLLLLTQVVVGGDVDVKSAVQQLLKRQQRVCKFDDRHCEVQGLVSWHSPTYVPDSNGCGSGAFKIDHPLFLPCCDQHDWCYGSCNVPKDQCDDSFLECMLERCNEHVKGVEAEECVRTAHGFKTATELFGCAAYLAGQKAACSCHEPREVTGREARVVRGSRNYALEKARPGVSHHEL